MTKTMDTSDEHRSVSPAADVTADHDSVNEVQEEHDPALSAEDAADDLPLRMRKRKKDWTPEEQAAYAAMRSQKRHARKAKKREVRNSRPEVEPEYTFEDGYRLVKSYVYEFHTYAKQRWLGRELLNMFSEEFGSNTPEYYRMAIRSGRITVNGKIVAPETIIRDRDYILHVAHRHEPPVLGQEIKIVYEDDDMLVVDKPPSMPTHACGAYRHNSLHAILRQMRPDIKQLNVVHRLDRLTSGVVIFAKTAAKAKELSLCISDREASKTYLARVRGHLPAQRDAAFQQQLVATAQANCAASEISFPDADTIFISCPLQCLSERDAVWQCHADGKESQTRVRVLRVDAHTTLVECKPITGRTHQIRLHLQLLGFPIANDPCYGGELHFGESAERRAVIALAEQNRESRDPEEGTVDFETPQLEHESEEQFLKRTCPWCHISRDAAYNETQLHCTKLWLHALQYKLSGHVFQVPEPDWVVPSTNY